MQKLDTLDTLREGFLMLHNFSKGRNDIMKKASAFQYAAPLVFNDMPATERCLGFYAYVKMFEIEHKMIRQYLEKQSVSEHDEDEKMKEKEKEKEKESDEYDYVFSFSAGTILYKGENHSPSYGDCCEYIEDFLYDREFSIKSVFKKHYQLWHSAYSEFANVRAVTFDELASYLELERQDDMPVKVSMIPEDIRWALTISSEIAGKWLRTGKVYFSDLVYWFEKTKLGSNDIKYFELVSYKREELPSIRRKILSGLDKVFAFYSYGHFADYSSQTSRNIFFCSAFDSLKYIVENDTSDEPCCELTLQLMASPLAFMYRCFRRSSYGKRCKRESPDIFSEVDMACGIFLNPTCFPNRFIGNYYLFSDGGYLGRPVAFGTSCYDSSPDQMREDYFSWNNMSRAFPLAHMLMDKGILLLDDKYHFLGRCRHERFPDGWRSF